VTNRVNLTPAAIREGHAFADNRFFGGKPTAVDHLSMCRLRSFQIRRLAPSG